MVYCFVLVHGLQLLIDVGLQLLIDVVCNCSCYRLELHFQWSTYLAHQSCLLAVGSHIQTSRNSMSNQLSRPSLNENVFYLHPSLLTVCLSVMDIYVAAELVCNPMTP